MNKKTPATNSRRLALHKVPIATQSMVTVSNIRFYVNNIKKDSA